jgi:hypothetical protein
LGLSGPVLPAPDSVRILATGGATTLAHFPLVSDNNYAAAGLWDALNRLPHPVPGGVTSCPAWSLGTLQLQFLHRGVEDGTATIFLSGCPGAIINDNDSRLLFGPGSAIGEVYATLAWLLGVPPNSLAGSATIPGTCPLTAIHDAAPWMGLDGIPWIATPGFDGLLLYARGGNYALHAGAPAQILWIAANAGSTLRIDGREDVTGKRYTTTATRDSAGQYPSRIDLPTPGCWRLTLDSSGTVWLLATSG